MQGWEAPWFTLHFMEKSTNVFPTAIPVTEIMRIRTITTTITETKPSPTNTPAAISQQPTGLQIPFPCPPFSNVFWWRSPLTARWLLMSRFSRWISRR